MRSIDAHRHRSDGGHSLPQGVFIALFHINVARAFGTNGVRLETALTVLITREKLTSYYHRDTL